MKLKKLLSEIEVLTVSDDKVYSRDITTVTSDSRKADKKSIFVCVEGLHVDGHKFAPAVSARGGVVVVQRDLGLKNQIVVKSTRNALGVLNAALQGNPSSKLKLVGVTGTNGKTTITTVIKQMLTWWGEKTGLLGTISYDFGETSLHAGYTTPGPEELQALLKRMLESGCKYVSMEVASQGLHQRRVDGCEFEVGVFTNLTQDHLDYHHTMDEYLAAKMLLFDKTKLAVLNVDDPNVKKAAETISCEKITFSTTGDDADYVAKDIRTYIDRVEFVLVSTGIIERMVFYMPGLFSVSNAIAALVTCIHLGMTISEAAEALRNARGVKGRMEVLPTNTDYTVICDYAHTPDALVNVLSTIKDFTKGRLVCLFGCAGNRDASKRKPMAEAVSKYADVAVISSDNPRDDDPVEIIKQVKSFMNPEVETYEFIDRLKGIKWCLDNAQADDVVVLCGKGHEDYQLMKGVTVYFDEREIVKDLLKDKN